MNALLEAPFFAPDRSGPSVADVQAFEALPSEVQLLARRVLLAPSSASADLVAAYEAGWEDGQEEVEIVRSRCYVSTAEILEATRDRLARKAGR